MLRRKPAPDLIWGGHRFAVKNMRRSKISQKHEAGEGQFSRPWAYPSPASLRWRLSPCRLPSPHASGGRHHAPPTFPHAASVSRNNGKKKLDANFPLAKGVACDWRARTIVPNCTGG